MLNTNFVSTLGTRRLVLVTGLAAVLAMTSTAGARLYQIEQSAQNRTVEIGASYRVFDSIADLTKQADLVVVGKVVGQGPTHLVGQPKPSLHPFTPATVNNLPPDKAARSSAELARASVPAILQTDAPPPPPTQPVTDFTVEVGRVLKGTLATGTRITVSQPGGTVELPTFPGGPTLSRTLVSEHDQLMTQGEQHLLFLGRTPDGRHYVVGGPQGRFAVDKGGKLHPVDPAAPVARQHSGTSLEALAGEVDRAAR